ELANPTERVLQKLIDRARSSAHQRVAHLRAHEADLRAERRLPKRTRPRDPSEMMFAGTGDKRDLTLADISIEDLYVQKRATELAEWPRAKGAFRGGGAASPPATALDRLLAGEDGRRAIAASVKSTKKQHIGTSMMDVIICGAVPPYSHLLGGKLACML